MKLTQEQEKERALQSFKYSLDRAASFLDLFNQKRCPSIVFSLELYTLSKRGKRLSKILSGNTSKLRTKLWVIQHIPFFSYLSKSGRKMIREGKDAAQEIIKEVVK